MPILHVVDAFCAGPFTGNPAAVCVLDADADVEWMQHVAAEMKHSETAFVRPLDGAFGLRWFTPTVEVDLCGHATLASAHVLFDLGMASGVVRFHTKSGMLKTTQVGDMLELDFPAIEFEPAEAVTGLFDSLGISVAPVLRARWDWLVELDTEAAVLALRPDLQRLAQVEARAVIVTARAESGRAYDFVSRCFGPRSGIPEDPATGSTHCVLTPYWAEKLGKTRMRSYQSSARGGHFEVELRGQRVAIAGRATTVLRGELCA